jgi:hypothetical protein
MQGPQDAASLIDELRQRLERAGWSWTETAQGTGWQVIGDDGKIRLLVQADTLLGAWVGLAAEVADEAIRRSQET